MAMNKRIKEAGEAGTFSPEKLCKFSQQHSGHCYKTCLTCSVAVAEENLCEQIARDLLLDKDGNPLDDDHALFAGVINADNDTKSPSRVMRVQNEIIGAAADNKAKHAPDQNHVAKNNNWESAKSSLSAKKPRGPNR